MGQTFTTDNQAITAPDGWMSFEELAEERWERASIWNSKSTVPAEIAESELLF